MEYVPRSAFQMSTPDNNEIHSSGSGFYSPKPFTYDNQSNGRLSRQNNDLGDRFLKNNGPNAIIYSPFSIFYALNLLYMGASRQSKDELADVLSVGDDPANLIKEMIRTSREIGLRGIAKVTNAFFVDNRFIDNIQQSYSKLMNKIGIMESKYFSTQSQKALIEINSWVSRETHGLIPYLLGPNDINKETRAVLINVIYFKANWANKFKKKDTQTQPFTRLEGNLQSLPLMYQKNKYSYYEDQMVQVVSLDYEDPDFELIIYLPRNLGSNNMLQLINQYSQYSTPFKMQRRDVEVYIPRFTQRFKINLRSVLQSWGINRIFNPEQSELENMINTEPYTINHLHVDKIAHEAVIIIDEEGSECAASTCIMMLSKNMVDDRSKIFRADHSFLYQLKYKPKNLVLFQGIYNGSK